MSDIPEKQLRGSRASTSGGVAGPNKQIATKLKALYSAVEQEPIPDVFIDLLEKLDQAERIGKSAL